MGGALVMKQGVLLLVLQLLVTAEAQGQPTIVTPDGQTLTSYVNGVVFISCDVENLGTHKLNWIFVKHSTTIFQGQEQMVDDSRYQWVHIPDSTRYSLQIVFANKDDQGAYKCAINGTDQAITLQLVLQDAPTPPDIDAVREPLNRTVCCKESGVNEECLPVCQPSSSSLSMSELVAACESDLPDLIYCGSNGRNHGDCCARSGVPAGCLLFCSNAQLRMSDLTSDKLVCLNHTDAIISCYEFGGALLPTAPESFSAISVSRNGTYSLQITWKPPQYNPSAVSGYRVFYKKRTDASFRATSVLNAATDKYSLPVQVNTRYIVYVIAVGDHGSSQPSNQIDILIEDTSPPGHATDVLACCQKRNVPPRCQTMLCHPRLWAHFNVTNILECYVYVTDVFSCLAGERDNSECCSDNNVPSLCVGMCSMHPPPFDNGNNLTSCILKLSVIEACIQRGLSSQPKIPQGVTVSKVKAHTAEVTWIHPNITSPSATTAYYVQLRRGNENAPWNTVAEVVGSFLKLTNLTETENYAVRVIAIGQNSSSLPSAVIRFTTYAETEEAERPTIAHNVTQCCVDSGMPSVCSNGCQYSASMTSYFESVLGVCFNYIGTVLTCAADGRDHKPCCIQRNVSEVCYDLCSHNSPGALDLRYIQCIEDTAKIVQCYQEGLENLVRMPEDVVVANLTSYTITIKWKNPETGPKPQKYQVEFVNLNSDKREQRNTTGLIYILQNLMPETPYTITVSSFLNDTSSPPTSPITTFTPPVDAELPFQPRPPTNTSRALWTNRTHCCQSSVISPPCQAVCMNSPATNATDCTAENHNILICAANGQDHTLCCQENGLPPECLPLCGSHAVTDFSIQLAGCLADATLTIITSCFLSNSGLLPSVPYGFVARSMQGSVVLEWTSASNCDKNDPCKYDAHYWLASNTDPSAYSTVWDVTSPLRLTDLTLNKRYTFTVTARNSKGSGAPASWVTIYVSSLYPEISIAQSPKQEVYEQDSTVYLSCDIYNLPGAPSFTWRLRDRILPTKGRILRLNNVNRMSEGNYSCQVTSGDVSVTAYSYVNVRFKPEFFYFRTDTVRPNAGEEAVLACWFRGHPNTDSHRTVWTKDGKPIPVGSSRYSATVKSRYHTGITAFKLKIAKLIPSDYGQYQCNVSNQFGYAVAHTKLMDPAKISPPIKPSPSQEKNVSGCCHARGVIDTCMPLCSMEVSAAEAIADPDKYGICLLFFSELIECAADGADHSLCCENKVVPALCLPFCKGEVPPVTNIYSSPHLLQCVPETPEILDCMDRGYGKIPTAPLHVVASFVSGKIKVAWDPPSRNAHRVTSYDIHYNFTGNPLVQTETVTKYVGFNHVLQNADTDHVYHIWMTAETYKFGRSQISKVVVISAHGSVPIPPTKITVINIKGTTVLIAWNKPPQTSTVAAEAFAVYYKPRNAVKAEKILTAETEITLKDLKENTEYEVRVASRNIDDEGPKSSPITFTTKEEELSRPDAEKQSGELGGGQIAGIVIAVLVVTAVVTLLAVLLYRSRLGKKAATESVSFENPSYGNQQVHIGGLPENNPYDSVMQPQTEPEKDGNFTYSRLREDQVPAESTATKPVSEADLPQPVYSTSADPGEISIDVSNGVAKPEALDADVKNESTT